MLLTEQEIKNYENQSLDIIRNTILKMVPKDDYAVFLFGSRADGNADRRSDVDVGIWGKAVLPLHLYAEIEDAMQHLNIPYSVDVVDFGRKDKAFVSVAIKKIIVWHQPSSFKFPSAN